MRVGDLRGWAEAVARARELYPEIPSWAFDLAADEPAEIRTYETSEWFSVHPTTAGEIATRVACARGWKIE
jgi:hypothetical protein